MFLPERRAGFRAASACVLVAALFGLSGCTTDPAPANGPKHLVQPILRDTQRALVAGRTPSSKPAVLSYCYSNLINTPEQLEVEATEACERMGGRLEFYGEDTVLAPCPLFQPVRATFLCYPPTGRSFDQPQQRLPSIEDPTEEQQRQEDLLRR